MSIIIKEVTNKKLLKDFIRFPNKLYKNSDKYTPFTEIDEFEAFNAKTNPALEHCEFINLLAYKDGEIVGRISGIINTIANEHWGVKKTRFGWFDFIDDYEVVKLLLDYVANWGRNKGMDLLNGPVGFTDFDHQGLLIEGFDYSATMISAYNYPYYQKHIERYGLIKEADWIENQLLLSSVVPEKIARVSDIVEKRYNLRVDKVHSMKDMKKKYGLTAFDVINEAYTPLYNFQPLTKKQLEYYANKFMPMLNYDFATLVINEKNEIVGVGAAFPDLSEALRKSKGRLFPFGWYYLLKTLKAKQFDCLEMAIIAVRPDYQNKGVNSIIFNDQIPYAAKYGVKRSETTAVLETNFKNLSSWDYFNVNQHKRRRAYIANL